MNELCCWLKTVLSAKIYRSLPSLVEEDIGTLTHDVFLVFQLANTAIVEVIPITAPKVPNSQLNYLQKAV